ncbi:hypothetical protein JIN85_05080 [Luteolibacter pohnpeiensis]|uniref:Uncharacterized protein n=1 Tax=Luteolibacter pohnpeiensis TaxID=454153 RepID=A0A934S5S2_9BACT|nr:hypothetical protein [Luteolibacter pohnpeiensis]MBK1881775.1 hypothetical protein [Luteolibacter pohnpeiensis]
MKNPWIVPVAALAVGAVGGFISGKNTGSSSSDTVAAEQAARMSRGSSRPGMGMDAASEKHSSKAKSASEIYKQPGQLSRVQGLIDYYSNLTPDQLADEAKKLANLPWNERMMASMVLFGRWAEVDPTAALEFSNTMGFAGAFAKSTILQSWASVDPENAARYYSENAKEFAMMNMMGGPGRGRDSAGATIAAEWAKQDPSAAMAWASTLETGKGQAMTAVISEVAKTDPSAAAAMVTSMDEADRQGAYEQIAKTWASTDFDAAKAWANSLPSDQRDAAMASAIEGLAQTDPATAANELSSLSGDAADRAVSTVMQYWAAEDPAKAAAWLQANASEQAQRRSMNELMPNWVNQDSAAALSYVQSQTGDVYDSAAASYIMSNTDGDPQELLSLTDNMGDGGDKFRSIGTISARWMEEDPTAAKAAIEEMDIPDGFKDRLINGGGGGGFRGGPGGGGNGGGGRRGR